MNSRIISLVVLALAIGLFFSFTKPTWAAVQQLLEVQSNNKEAMDAVRQFATQKQDLESKKGSIDPEALKKLNDMLPSSVDNVKNILMIDDLGKKAGLRISNLDAVTRAESAASARAQSGTAPDSIDLSVTAEGTYASFSTFLESLERSQTLFDVRDVSVKGSNNGIYQYSLKIRFYWLR